MDIIISTSARMQIIIILNWNNIFKSLLYYYLYPYNLLFIIALIQKLPIFLKFHKITGKTHMLYQIDYKLLIGYDYE